MAKKEVTFLSPRGRPVIAHGNTIRFPAMSYWEKVPATTARIAADKPEAPWPPNMEALIDLWKGGAMVNLAHNGQIRLGVSAGLIARMPPLGKLAPIFVQFDATHPRRPLELSPPAGILSRRNIIVDALEELGEEVIITMPKTDGPTEAWHWSFGNRGLCLPWVKAYTKANKMIVSENGVAVQLTYEFPGLIDLYFGQRVRFKGWVAFEPDTGSVEIIIPLIASLPNGAILQDGEILPNGRYRGSRVVPLLLTDKARVVTEAFIKAK